MNWPQIFNGSVVVSDGPYFVQVSGPTTIIRGAHNAQAMMDTEAFVRLARGAVAALGQLVARPGGAA